MRLRLASATVVVIIGAVGSAGASTPTRASWAAAANKICGKANAFVRSLPTPTTQKVFIADARATIRISPGVDRALAAIPRPANERSKIQALIAASQLETSLLPQFLRAMTRNDQGSMRRLGGRLDRLDSRFNALARQLGARVCAENPEPQG